MSLIDVCRSVIATDSSPDHGSVVAAEVMGEYATSLGLAVEYQRERQDGREEVNVLVRLPPVEPEPESRRELLFTASLASADPGEYALWAETGGNPFFATLRGDRIYGLGAESGKLDLVAQITAAGRFARRRLSRRGLVVVGTYDGHGQMDGVIRLLRRKKVRADAAVIGRPTQMRLANEAPGLVSFEISLAFSDEERTYRENHDLIESTTSQCRLFSATPGHSGNSSQDNAVVKLFQFLEKLPDGMALLEVDGGSAHRSFPAYAALELDVAGGLTETMVSKLARLWRLAQGIQDDLNILVGRHTAEPEASVQLTRIKSQQTHVRVSGACPLLPQVPLSIYQEALARLRGLVNQAGGELQILDQKLPFSTGSEAEVVVAAQSALSDIDATQELWTGSAATEGSVLQRLGIDSVVFGAGSPKGLMSFPNENVSVEDLRRSISFYEKLIERMCL